MTTEDAYNDYLIKLKNIYEPRESRIIADWTFESITGAKRLDRIMDKHTTLTNLHVAKLARALEELLQHKPIQYVLGEAWWYKMKFFVNEHVLIPRPETEELVEWIIEVNLENKNEKLNILDIGTGSGCIAIALKRELPGAKIVALDVSAEALLISKQNADKHHTSIELLALDFLNEETWNKLSSFDIIVSNPPYIPEEEKMNIKDNVVKFEPHIALFTPANDPFIFYKKIALFAKWHLKTTGKVFVEVHEAFAQEVKEVFCQNEFHSILKKDIYGRDRMICAYR